MTNLVVALSQLGLTRIGRGGLIPSVGLLALRATSKHCRRSTSTLTELLKDRHTHCVVLA